jgi:hypothetical protein
MIAKKAQVFKQTFTAYDGNAIGMCQLRSNDYTN